MIYHISLHYEHHLIGGIHHGQRGIVLSGASQVRSQVCTCRAVSVTTPREAFLFFTRSLASSTSFWVMSMYLSSAQIELGLSLVLSPSDHDRWGTSATVLPWLYSGTCMALWYFWLAVASSLSLSLLLSFILSRAQGGQMARISVPSCSHFSLLSSLAIRQVLQASTERTQCLGKNSNLKDGDVERTCEPSGLTNLGFFKGSQWAVK